jgi:hypothetical protein
VGACRARILNEEFLCVLEVVEGIEGDLGARGDLLVAGERERVGERGTKHGVGSERVDDRGKVSRLHRDSELELGGPFFNRGTNASSWVNLSD